MRGPTGRAQQVALLVVLTQTLALSLAGAFQLWPKRLTKPLASSKQEPNLVYKPNQRQQTSTTTTSTTTSAPHTDLVFLIDAEDLNQQEQGDQMAQQTLNDTMILEEVVNHIHRNLKLNSNKNCTNCAGQESQKFQTISEFDLSNQFPNGQINKSAQYKLNEGQAEPTTTPSTSAGAAYISLAEVDDENSRSPGTSSNETANETSNEPDDDRHIQYDTIVTSSPISFEELRRQQMGGSGANQMTIANFTLNHSNLIETDSEEKSDEHSQQLPSAPLMIVAAIGNVSVDTLATSPPPITSNLSNNSSLSQRAANTSQAQARSMSGVSSRLPQHSKAPYASYNLFNHNRQDSNNNNHVAEATPIPSGNLTGKTATAQSISQESPMSSNKQLINQPIQQVNNSTNPARGVIEGGELANSVSKISMHLTGENSKNPAAQTSATSGGGGASQNQTSTNGTEIQTTTSSMKPMSLVDKLQAYINGNVNLSASRQEPSSELERVVLKLAPTNELVELDPLPSSEQSLASAQTPLSERYYSSSSSSGQNKRRDQIGSRQGDRYLAEFFSEDEPSEYHHQMAHGYGDHSTNTQQANRGSQQSEFDRDILKNVVGELLSDGAQLDDQPTTPAPILHRKTIEILSNQIKNSDNNLLASSSNTMAVHQHKERSPPVQQPQPQQQTLMAPVNRELNAGSRHHQTAGGTFAASLINVTAPMVLPLSASEAMENSMATQLQQHQSGRQENQQRAGQHSAPHRSNYYVLPQSPSNMAHESIYMRPMNQFRPTTTTGSSTQSSNGHEFNVAERDRTRLEQRLAASQFASGFRSPQSQFNPSASSQSNMMTSWASLHGGNNLPTPASYLNALESTSAGSSLMPLGSPSSASMATTLPSITTSGNKYTGSTQTTPSSGGASNKDNIISDASTRPQPIKQQQNSTTATVQKPQQLAGTTNGFITGTIVNTTLQQSQTDLIGTVMGGSALPSTSGGVSTQVVAGGANQQQQQSGGSGKRAFNLTRVEHISAECSNDLIRAIIIFNGTFKGIIYSSGYVRDTNCLYINGTGKTRYDFSIKLNQCGTLGRQELHSPTGPDEVRRRDQVMWNSLSIQYNPIIEQEWDEHFRVSCEYGSDFWKTISFNPFNVETNTGSPVVFTVDPPQCQMEILKGHGMVGPRQEATSGPVTVGDPLTLLIHMKSEKAGYDILVKNCIAHDGSQQKMQLIDSNGCVVNERFISPFRGTYNDQDLKHVTLYSYLKAFRFTGSPVLYLECEVHMCQSACPPQMCYWRSISKRSVGSNITNETYENFDTSLTPSETYDQHNELRRDLSTSTTTETSTTGSILRKSSQRTGKNMRSSDGDVAKRTPHEPARQKNLSDKISLTQALEVRHERFSPDPTQAATGLAPFSVYDERFGLNDFTDANLPSANQLMCYQRIEIFAFLFTVASILLAAISVTIGCYCRASSLKRQSMTPTGGGQQRRSTHQPDEAKQRHSFEWLPRVHLLSPLNDSANLCYSPMSSSSASSPLSSPITFVGGGNNDNSKRSACSPYINSSSSTRPQIYGRAPSSFNNLLGTGNLGDNLVQENRGPPKRPFAVNYNQRSQLARSAETNDVRLLATKLARRN